MRSLLASLLLATLGAVSVTLAVPATSTAQTNQTTVHHHRTHHPAPKPRVVTHSHRVVHRHVVVHRTIHRLPVHHRIVRHPVVRHPIHHPHAVITRRTTTIHRGTVRHVTVVRRHTTLCQQVMVHQHWVQRCR